MVKYGALIYILFLTTSCSLYESEARVFLRERAFSGYPAALVEQNVVNSNGIIESCSPSASIQQNFEHQIPTPSPLPEDTVIFFDQKLYSYSWFEHENFYLACQSKIITNDKDEIEYYKYIKIIIEELKE